MLVISRKNGQKIMLNDNIVITVVEATYGQCKIAIDADKSVKIYREEIYYKIKLANLIGQNSNTKEAESVSNMINSSDVKINNKINTVHPQDDDEFYDKKNYSKKIIINRKNQNDTL